MIIQEQNTDADESKKVHKCVRSFKIPMNKKGKLKRSKFWQNIIL